jgi:hypothetical protein
MDHHHIAAISLAGTCLDVVGSLYLAYDLLGGEHGPLRLLTRAVTYSVVFGIGYGIGLGLIFGLVAGAATGITVAIELQRAAHHQDHYPLRWEAFFSGIRGLGFAVGLAPVAGVEYAAVFGMLMMGGQTIAYARGIRPGMDYSARRRPRLTLRQLWSGIERAIGAIAAGLICSALIHPVGHDDWLFALHIGVTSGLTTTIGITFNPFIEYYADNLPERRMGVIGIALILIGFSLQSLQYWLALFDVRIA